ncbi:class I SAM-dependent methyltransferase [Sinorhizobium alkalisoli]|uniref:Methyltransferase type 12 n=1 Tax=Sinorhizobium alkalisoli TaxID=1752398 RepID=A0A1E3VFP4_9HYPH|nr:class I SAM-dependent methyltransferase [Sinorhizobium alkalisoli]MCA1491801.1 methyltransferase domain-containing protein [Ensifer sp. NBAIM29]MCG5481371.1 methyltransferase domain-containing protein [Sinorhizobium alkalisoli]ODR92413.1 methyltransferase type 12 [Sinorhizobium alkalisoli]QFI66893.1 SAM-dependent methyltransferase [Sinorhizobium alkalisoli]
MQHIHRGAIDSAKLDALVARAVGDLSAGYGGVMISLGNRLGLYKAMAGAGPLSARELAKRSGCAERYVCEWLNSQVAGGYVSYHSVSNTYELTPEQALVLADPDSPTFIPNAWAVPASMWADENKAVEAFRTGRGIPWGDHDGRLSCGVASFYRNAYKASLVSEWLPALDGVVDKLEAGGLVADIGCGHGHSTVLMAEAFPASRFCGFDTHQESLFEARKAAAKAGIADQTTFREARADGYPGKDYDLICFFDALHDMGDPVAAASHAAKALAPDGVVMLVEPFANDRVEDNISPVGRLYYAASTTICCAHAISDGGRLVLGAQAGEGRLADVFRKAGFTRFRRAFETPFNLVLEAKL